MKRYLVSSEPLPWKKQNMPKNNYVFLIRAYNESSRIVSVIEGIVDAGYDQIVVVDDGSTDATYELLEEKFWENIHLLRHIVNRGGGAALATGFEYISENYKKYDWECVITFDADGQMDISDMETFVHYQKEHPEARVIFGSRFIQKTRSNVPWYRRVVLYGGKIFTALISGVALTDAHNGYRMIATDILPRIGITMDGMEYASELIDEIGRLGHPIHEVPVHIHYDEYTLAKWQRFGGAFRIATKMFYKKFF